MPGEVEKTDGVFIKATTKITDGFIHFLFIGIFNQGNVETGFFQRLFHGTGIGNRVGKSAFVVIGIANDEGNALGFCQRQLAAGKQQGEGLQDFTHGNVLFTWGQGYYGIKRRRILR